MLAKRFRSYSAKKQYIAVCVRTNTSPFARAGVDQITSSRSVVESTSHSPSPLTTESFSVADLKIQLLQVVIPAVGLLIAVALHLFSYRTKYGKALLAVVQNPDAARLMGINVTAAIVLTYALSGLFAGIAGVLIAPLFIISSTMGTLFGIKAFAVAILGGITNAWGVMVAGLVYGLAEALITALLGSTYTQIVTFTLIIVALALRPHGLFGRAEVKKV
ncbi:MAG: branched-chain amino acid ABC transporter permease [Proteobacteria bacterium]|nr:branched-chain amino acid ABC transporter permease [Pseudomonadota bacterium]